MTAMFPASGVPWSDAFNSLSDPASVNCDELWYSTSRCAPRFDPAAANAVLAELVNLINKGEVTYDCHFLDQVQTAVRYLIQRGIPRAAYLAGGPNAYTSTLDPPLTRYNNFLTLTIVTAVTNAGAVTFDGGKGPAPVLRNDGLPLERTDLRAGIPYIIAFINGYWYVCGMVASQVPLLVKGGIDCWIRTDGNDTTGDGTANTPDKAFRTIVGCWQNVSSRYAATPLFSINMKLGIPGTYDGGVIGPFGGVVTLTGDRTAPAAYRIANFNAHPNMWTSLWCQSMSNFGLYGVTILCNRPAPDSCPAIRILQTNCIMADCRIEVLTSNPSGATMIECRQGSFGTTRGTLNFVGNGLSVNTIFNVFNLGNIIGGYVLPGETSEYFFNNIVVSACSMALAGISSVHWDGATFHPTGVTGVAYQVVENSILNMNGRAILGTSPGAGGLGTGGQFIA